MIFTYSKNNKIHKKQNKYIEVEVNNDKSLNSLLRELESINLQDHLDFNWSPDPNVNFENFMNI